MKTETVLSRNGMLASGLRELASRARRWVVDLPQSVRAKGLLRTISDAFSEHERHDRRVTKIMMSAQEYSLLRRLSPRVIEPRTAVDELNAGWMADLWGARVIVRKNAGGKVAVFS